MNHRYTGMWTVILAILGLGISGCETFQKSSPQDKADRATTRAENRVENETNQAIDRGVDRTMDRIFR